MLFNSPEFLFAFLPAFLILYFLSPGRLKNAILFLASLLFYFTTSAELTLVLIASVIFNYWAALRIGKAAGPRRQFLFALAVGSISRRSCTTSMRASFLMRPAMR